MPNLCFYRVLRVMNLLLHQDLKMMSTFIKQWILLLQSFSTLTLKWNALLWSCLRRRLKNWAILVSFSIVILQGRHNLSWSKGKSSALLSVLISADGQFVKSSIAEFVFANKLPLVTTFTRESAPAIFESPTKKQVSWFLYVSVIKLTLELKV